MTEEWVGRHLPGVFSRWHRENRSLPRETEAAIIEAAGIRPGSVVLDIGCGSGIPTLTIAEQVGPAGRVAAVEPSPVFIEAITRSVAASGLDNVDIVRASVTVMPFPPATFDAATCHFSAMFFPDLPGALAAIRRVLRPGGRAAFVAWGPAEENRMIGPPPPIGGDPTEVPWPTRWRRPGLRMCGRSSRW